MMKLQIIFQCSYKFRTNIYNFSRLYRAYIFLRCYTLIVFKNYFTGGFIKMLKHEIKLQKHIGFTPHH